VCGKFTQHSPWSEVYAFSQPLVIRKPDELVASTPMRPAFIMHLDGEGQRVMTAIALGLVTWAPNPASYPSNSAKQAQIS
jgi:hypothetical protein